MIITDKTGKEIRKPDGDELGLISTRKNRTTGYYVSLYHSNEAGIESDPDLPYTTVCEQHGNVVCHSTRRLAVWGQSDPLGFCEDCREELGVNYRNPNLGDDPEDEEEETSPEEPETSPLAHQESLQAESSEMMDDEPSPSSVKPSRGDREYDYTTAPEDRWRRFLRCPKCNRMGFRKPVPHKVGKFVYTHRETYRGSELVSSETCEVSIPDDLYTVAPLRFGRWSFNLFIQGAGGIWDYRLKTETDLIQEGNGLSSLGECLELGKQRAQSWIEEQNRKVRNLGTYTITEEEAEQILAGEPEEETSDRESIMEQVSQMDKGEVLELLRVLSGRLIEIVQEEEGDFLRGMDPGEVSMLPVQTVNLLAESGELLNIGQAQERLGFTARASVYTAANTNSFPLRNLRVGGGDEKRYFFTEDWINDYNENKPGRGRRKQTETSE